ncbi:uncharacterized protein Cp110 [Venturia canescens]|uniref:uncharacterized protein Cp110 n=1 Tax=Venturia canescens TaxID=32260 RepID=UPI001C9C0EB0|nr:uncharacterized protein LOC122418853 [Venturia canescens]
MENELQLGEERDSSTVVETASTDINRYLDDTLTSDTVVSTLDNSPEWKKPEVPKTLDIVPITLVATNVENGKVDEWSGESQENWNQASDVDTITTTPKLVRQGSYVLETPSPLLLAHLRDESTFVFEDYTPSSRQSNQVSRRKEWNINEAKSEWELRKTRNSIVVMDTRDGLSCYRNGRVRRNSASGAIQGRTSGSKVMEGRTTGGRYFSGAREIARSADCIQSMLYRESLIKNTKSSTIAMTNGHSGKDKESSCRVNTATSWKITRSVSVPSCGNKIGGSLGNLRNGSPTVKRTSKRSTTSTPQKQMSLSRSFDKSLNNSNPTSFGTKSSSQTLRGSTQKLLSTVTSEKLIDVFKEIQNTHERQMSQLVARQQQEQRNMQKEFEKQQILLLAQIEQTFPGIRLSGLADKITGHSTNVNSSEKSDTPPPPKRSDPKDVKCPLDGIYPTENEIRSNDGKLPLSPAINGNYHLQCSQSINGQRKNYAVSRQLFPLESKTSHVPVLDKRTTYEDKHIKAATIINAYARGYLVRRIMQTERVLALKSTYGEALRCMLRLHVDAPLALPELNFHQRLQLQCDAASINIVELFAQEPAKRMEIIEQDRQIKKARQERPNSARSCYSFATQRTLARKKLKEMGDFEKAIGNRSTTVRSRCQTWTFNSRDKRSPSLINQGIKRSTSAGAVRKPWR